jgi:hypothetical protein
MTLSLVCRLQAVMLYTYQHKSLDYLARKFKVSYFDAKEIIIRSRFGGACG